MELKNKKKGRFENILTFALLGVVVGLLWGVLPVTVKIKVLHIIPEWLTLGLLFAAAFPFAGGVLSAYSELFIAKKRVDARLKRNLVIFGSLLSITGALLGAVFQGRESFRLWAFSTGANDFCYVRYAFRTSNALKFIFMNDGDYPLFDVVMDVTDENRVKPLPGMGQGFTQLPFEVIEPLLRQVQETTVQIPIGNVRPNEARFIWDAPIPKDDLQDYHIDFWARNGFLEEEILLRRKDDSSFVSALRVWKQTATIVKGWHQFELIKEEVPDDFRILYPSGVPWTRFAQP